MFGGIKDKLIKLKKDMLKTILFMCGGYIMLRIVSLNGLTMFLPIFEVMLTLLNVDEDIHRFIYNLYGMFFSVIPVVPLIFGQRKFFEVSNQIFDLKNEVDRFVVKQEREINLRQQKPLIKDIIAKIEKLPRNKQMEILNFIKGYVSSEYTPLHSQIHSLNDVSVEFLQSQLEDILFSSDMLDDGYKRVRNIENERMNIVHNDEED